MAKWAPDIQLVPAILAGRPVRLVDLDPPDRCWVVAGLGPAGANLTVDEIADRTHCCRRLVQAIRAEPMTTLAEWAIREANTFADEMRLARSEQKRLTGELSAASADLKRARDAVIRLSTPPGRRWPLCPKGKHPMNPANVYRHAGREYCRRCHAQRQSDYRRRSCAGT